VELIRDRVRSWNLIESEVPGNEKNGFTQRRSEEDSVIAFGRIAARSNPLAQGSEGRAAAAEDEASLPITNSAWSSTISTDTPVRLTAFDDGKHYSVLSCRPVRGG
jgi:hypothetical protein